MESRLIASSHIDSFRATCAEATPSALHTKTFQSGMCAFCSTELAAVPKMCDGCRSVCYCGRRCQKAHWSVHRHECNRLCIIVRFISGEAQAFPGFKHDQLTRVLQEEVLKWLSANRELSSRDVDVVLCNGDRVLDTGKTFRDLQLTDGMEISASINWDPCPDLIDSPPTPPQRQISESSSDSSDEEYEPVHVFVVVPKNANSRAGGVAETARNRSAPG